eukprot:m.68195 g.68195  ORF g.68195 m.68195 type:complete len:536 (-) comp11947_c0_seq2:73-1680(-)
MSDEDETQEAVPASTPPAPSPETDHEEPGESDANPEWGKLIPQTSSAYAATLSSNEFTIGRSRKCNQVIVGLTTISSSHTKFEFDSTTNEAYITDTSTNGTCVNGARLKKGERVKLDDGDEIVLAGDPKAMKDKVPSYLFRVRGLTKKRKRKSDTAAGKAPLKKKSMDLEEHLTCPICREIFYKPIALLPCLHTYCSACYSQWMVKSQACPDCRGVVDSVTANHKTTSLVDAYLEKYPEKKKTKEEMEEMDKNNKISKDHFKPKKSTYHADDYDSEEDDDDYDGGGGGFGGGGLFQAAVGLISSTIFPAATQCRECTTQGTLSGHQCVTGQIHRLCQACNGYMPQRTPPVNPPQRCVWCNMEYCNLYFSDRGGCPSVNNGSHKGLIRLKDASVEDSVWSSHIEHVRAFGGGIDFHRCSFNQVERQILKDYLSEKNISTQDLFSQCREKLLAGEYTAAVAVAPRAQIDGESPMCQRCVNLLFCCLSYQYRAKIDKDDLPAIVSAKNDCWYGYNCRTQFHNHNHAANLNHVCPQTKF